MTFRYVSLVVCLDVKKSQSFNKFEWKILSLNNSKYNCHLASKTLALSFSHDARKNKDQGEKSHSKSLASKTLHQLYTREGRREHIEFEKFWNIRRELGQAG